MNNTNSSKIFPVVVKDGNYVLPFPFAPNDTIDPVNSVKLYLKVKEINIDDIDSIIKIIGILDWYSLLLNIIQNKEIDQLDSKLLEDIKLSSRILLEYRTEPNINVFIEINTDLKIKIIKNETNYPMV